MKPDLVIGLGNPLMGDDGAGAAAAEVLANDRTLARHVDVISADTDVLSCANRMERRRRVLLIDAVEGEVPGAFPCCANPHRSKGSSTRITSRPPPCSPCSAR